MNFRFKRVKSESCHIDGIQSP